MVEFKSYINGNTEKPVLGYFIGDPEVKGALFLDQDDDERVFVPEEAFPRLAHILTEDLQGSIDLKDGFEFFAHIDEDGDLVLRSIEAESGLLQVVLISSTSRDALVADLSAPESDLVVFSDKGTSIRFPFEMVQALSDNDVPLEEAQRLVVNIVEKVNLSEEYATAPGPEIVIAELLRIPNEEVEVVDSAPVPTEEPVSVGMPTDAQSRKGVPIYSGVMLYFPDALVEVARVSKAGNEQHHPGQPLHWDKTKSTDHGDALIRHQLEAGTKDTDGYRHSAKVAWRALAQLQAELDAEK